MSEDNREKVWWTQPRSFNRSARLVKPYVSGVELENEQLQQMADMSSALYRYQPVEGAYAPVEFRYLNKRLSEKAQDLPDAFIAHDAATIVSERFVNTVSSFDLGDTQIIELPHYAIKDRTKMGRTVANRERQDPRRWFLFNVTNHQYALRPDDSDGLYKHSTIFAGQTVPQRYTFEHSKPKIAVDTDIATSGPDIWIDPEIQNCVCFSDALRAAIKKANLKTPYYVFKPCLLV